ncbi:hypothetical protein [uncultured Xylophilus sp.]|uniref:hypothetical protein n=1 Tax=uncultured Xylophilus sp. TaxID=296832 RepID=UPI0025E8B0AC|nr:hypothetical protein [uncultured Xylophilus sp.]
MSIYSHFTDEQLVATRDQLSASLQARLTTPTSVGFNGRTASFQQQTSEIRKEIQAVTLEIDRRAGTSATARAPIYLV